jgi:DNA-binding response OmpR family regulator
VEFRPSIRHAEPVASPAILIVDDDQGTRETFHWGLRPAGFRVFTASSGAEALAIATDRPVDLLLLDLLLGDMRGTDVIRTLRPTFKAPFILMSGFLTTEITVEAMRLGAFDVIPKPISIEALPALLDSALGRTALPALEESAEEVAWTAVIRAAESCQSMPPRSAAERCAMNVLKGCASDRDPKTFGLWADCASTCATSLRENCQLVEIEPRDARDFMRVLRAVIRGAALECPPGVLLNIGDPRTLDRLVRRAGFRSPEELDLLPLDDFLERQRFIAAGNAALRVLRDILASGRRS